MRDKNSTNSITLAEWLSGSYDSESVHTLFINMDKSMKYLHGKGFCVSSFNPANIEILNGSLQQIKFDEIEAMPTDSATVQKEFVRDDIGRSALLQVNIYFYYGSRYDFPGKRFFGPDFIKDNFEQFAVVLPDDDIPYYKGIFERKAAVYFSDYSFQKDKRALEGIENELAATDGGKGRALVKSNDLSTLDNYDSTNSRVNDNIYKQINSMSDAAYVSFFIIPFLVAIVGFILMLVAYFS